MTHLWPASTSAILFRALSTAAIPPRLKPRRAGHGALAVIGVLHIFAKRWIIQATEHTAITNAPYCSAKGHQGRVSFSSAATIGIVLGGGGLGSTTWGVCTVGAVAGAGSRGASGVRPRPVLRPSP